ncbi:hypothetical protein KBC97_01770 [Candidatus Gracilibacteria bacterium]|nr:hypothetical protein [Candidatus Gracilibacteria bacterium]
MFRERYLIQMSGGHGHGGGHGDGGTMENIAGALNPLKEKADVYANLLHNNDKTSSWNSHKIEVARQGSVDIKAVSNGTRNRIKEALWDLPGQAGKKLLKALTEPILTFPAWLWTKTTQLPSNLFKLVTSGAVVINAEMWQALDAPARLMIKTNNKIQAAIDGLGGGGHGHGHAAGGHH